MMRSNNLRSQGPTGWIFLRYLNSSFLRFVKGLGEDVCVLLRDVDDVEREFLNDVLRVHLFLLFSIGLLYDARENVRGTWDWLI